MKTLPQQNTGSLSLLWRILLPTSVAVTLLFAIAGWMIQNYVARVSQRGLEEEIDLSLRAYQGLWSERAAGLASIGRVMSSMSDVRAAFMTRDEATIRDTAQQLWSQISEQDASFLVADPTGQVIATLGGTLPELPKLNSLMKAALPRFPGQVSGYVNWNRDLYYVVLTPVYVDANGGRALLNVLLLALEINDKLASELKRSTNGTDFAFVAENRALAATILWSPGGLDGNTVEGHASRVLVGGVESLALKTILQSPQGTPEAELFVIRSFAAPQQVISTLRRNVGFIWLLTIAVGVLLTYLLTKRILRPVERLDRAAGEVIRQNYSYRVPIESRDELGRLAISFNAMCDSIQSAREELIRNERIATIGRLSSSIVHDLRNPLAAIYGGAEMLVDAELSPEQSRRLAGNIYRSSRRIQELLQELLDVSVSKKRAVEPASLNDIVLAAVESIARPAETQGISVKVKLPAAVQIDADQDRLSRVFLNLINNALEAMPEGGTLDIYASLEERNVVVHIDDTGPGILEEAWVTLFQPFASFGKKNGLGLGLALSRQTVADHGGELWAERNAGAGARFHVRLPLSGRDSGRNNGQNKSFKPN